MLRSQAFPRGLNYLQEHPEPDLRTHLRCHDGTRDKAPAQPEAVTASCASISDVPPPCKSVEDFGRRIQQYMSKVGNMQYWDESRGPSRAILTMLVHGPLPKRHVRQFAFGG